MQPTQRSTRTRLLAAAWRATSQPAALSQRALASRRPHRWLGTVGVGLAITTAALAGLFLLFPVCALASWWFLPREPFGPPSAVGLGVVGIAWASVGIGLLAFEPPLEVGAFWVSLALLLAAARLEVDRHLPRLRT